MRINGFSYFFNRNENVSHHRFIFFPPFFYVNAVPCIPWRYMRLANFVIKWSRSVSRADAAGNGRLKWLASSHLYYRWIELIFKVRPIMGFPLVSNVSPYGKERAIFTWTRPPFCNQSVSISCRSSPLPSFSRVFVSSCSTSFDPFENATLIRVQGAKKDRG